MSTTNYPAGTLVRFTADERDALLVDAETADERAFALATYTVIRVKQRTVQARAADGRTVTLGTVDLVEVA